MVIGKLILAFNFILLHIMNIKGLRASAWAYVRRASAWAYVRQRKMSSH